MWCQIHRSWIGLQAMAPTLIGIALLFAAACICVYLMHAETVEEGEEW